MKLGEAQENFSVMIAKLILWADGQGYKVRMGEGYDDDNTGHMKGSLHYIKLAQDLFVYKPGATEQDMEAHRRMHDCWDQLGGAPRIEKDMNHYSVKWEGRW